MRLISEKRPLGVFAVCFFVSTFCATRLPGVVLLPLAIVLAAAFLICWWGQRRKPPLGTAPKNMFAGLVLLAGAGALLLFFVHNQVWLRPVLRLAGTQIQATARVVDARPATGGDIDTVSLQVLQINGEKAPQKFKVDVILPAQFEVGDMLEVPLALVQKTGTRAAYELAKGRPLRGFAKGEAVKTGEAHTLLTYLRVLQYTTGQAIQQRLPRRLAGVAAAMAVGDRRFLSANVTEGYRAAGLSHMLVVSGLHLSIVSGAVHQLASRFLRKKAAAVVCLLFVLGFMGFSGAAPSVIRSGIGYCFVFLATIIVKRADIYTSLGVAALLLCVQNPYAATDVGLQLSFAGTLGALQADTVAKAGTRIWRRIKPVLKHGAVIAKTKPTKFAAVGRFFKGQLMVALCVTVTTLPVLVLAGASISLLSLPMNVIAVPLLAPTVLCSFLMALPVSVPVLGWIGTVAEIIGGTLLRVLELLTGWCAGLPGALLPLDGFLVAGVVAAVYWFGFLAAKSQTGKKAAVFIAAALLLVPSAALLGQALQADTLRITLAGSGAAASVIVVKNRQAIVLYRGRQSSNAVQQVLKEQRVQDVTLLVDMRKTAESTEYENALKPKQVVRGEDFLTKRMYQPLPGVALYLKKQPEGLLACVSAQNYRVGVASGKLQVADDMPMDVLIPGSAQVQARYKTLLTTGAPPDWAQKDCVVTGESGIMIWIREGTSARVRQP